MNLAPITITLTPASKGRFAWLPDTQPWRREALADKQGSQADQHAADRGRQVAAEAGCSRIDPNHHEARRLPPTGHERHRGRGGRQQASSAYLRPSADHEIRPP
jgi:hypothetical protein